MSRLVTVLGAGGILLLWGICQMPSGSREAASRQTLSISEEPDRILLGWSGPVQEPMSERVGAALDQFKSDQRRLVLVLNSPGGSIEHGRKVVAAIRARNRAMDTFVQKAGVCASMCVPIFLAGTKRVADPDAYFMFHEASLTGSARDMMKRQELGEANRAVVAEVVKTRDASHRRPVPQGHGNSPRQHRLARGTAQEDSRPRYLDERSTTRRRGLRRRRQPGRHTVPIEAVLADPFRNRGMSEGFLANPRGSMPERSIRQRVSSHI
ncbi:ATP-dependent Clp protease proteolytic subunit [Bradyrhizobium sp. 62B]|uniref:ATP-dependent Clp protease proteolytic subunit n=1 Tax=Bradyrhizobium sp. 62B TaxID=2898442 RepID=UPI0025581153|nr:ATP-dependent Clp protease proteolytic subunit [Bradyrhizobium sp. 62B]